MKKIKIITIIVTIITFSNCYSTGKIIKNQDYDKIIEKQSSKADVDKLLGTPSSTDANTNGYTVYVYQGYKISWFGWIPILGDFLSSGKCTVATFTFDKEKKVIGKSFADENR
jgi:outer membrane protein assembly factor BamE (lipoprotein component of BamABCDE complex)